MIFVGIGSNLSSSRFGVPRNTCEAALAALSGREISVVRVSGWYRSAPVPMSDQPDFVNGVAGVETDAPPADLLDTLLGIEAEFGRKRTIPNASRILDLDLLAYHDLVVGEGVRLRLPHPRMAQRAFVLLPLREIAAGWRHPVLDRTVETLIEELPPGQICERLP